MKLLSILLTALIISFSAIAQNPGQERLNDPLNKLGFTLYKDLLTDNGNFMFSPLSIYSALSMLTEGSAGPTKEQLVELLGSGYSKYFKKAFNNSLQKNGENALKLFNSAWYNKKFSLNTAYFDHLQNYYYADIFSYTDDKIPELNRQANKWVSTRTNHKIKELPVPVNPETMITLLNVAYFLAEWDIEFDKKDTKERTFHSIEKRKQKTDFMYKRGQLNYFEDDQVQAVKLPYKNDAYSMLLVLPKSRNGLETLEQSITNTVFEKIYGSLSYNDVKLYLPKFKIESETSLSKSPPVAKIFNSNADFSLIDPLKRNIGSDIIHKTFIEIDEKKTEAAALTEVILIGYAGRRKKPPPPKIVDADHPFLFFVVENQTNSIAFMGRYINAEIVK